MPNYDEISEYANTTVNNFVGAVQNFLFENACNEGEYKDLATSVYNYFFGSVQCPQPDYDEQCEVDYAYMLPLAAMTATTALAVGYSAMRYYNKPEVKPATLIEGESIVKPVKAAKTASLHGELNISKPLVQKSRYDEELASQLKEAEARCHQALDKLVNCGKAHDAQLILDRRAMLFSAAKKVADSTVAMFNAEGPALAATPRK